VPAVEETPRLALMFQKIKSDKLGVEKSNDLIKLIYECKMWTNLLLSVFQHFHSPVCNGCGSL